MCSAAEELDYALLWSTEGPGAMLAAGKIFMTQFHLEHFCRLTLTQHNYSGVLNTMGPVLNTIGPDAM